MNDLDSFDVFDFTFYQKNNQSLSHSKNEQNMASMESSSSIPSEFFLPMQDCDQFILDGYHMEQNLSINEYVGNSLSLQLDMGCSNQAQQTNISSLEFLPFEQQPLHLIEPQLSMIKSKKTSKNARKHFFPHFMILLRSYIRETQPDHEGLLELLNLNRPTNKFTKREFMKIVRKCPVIIEEIILSGEILLHLETKSKHRFLESTKELIRKNFQQLRQFIESKNYQTRDFKWTLKQ